MGEVVQGEESADRGGRKKSREPQRPSWGNQVWYWLVQHVLQLLLIVIYRLRRWGTENIPAEGPVLLASNHQSHFDPPLVGCCSPRRASYVARASLFDFRPFGWLIGSFGAFPIHRDGRGISGIKETLRRLKRGEMILIFPEGARTADGEIAPFRGGVRTLALRSNATIVPVALEGAYRAWPRSKKYPGPGRMHVRFAKPIRPEEIRELGEEALLAEVERRVREAHAIVRSHPAFWGKRG